MGKPFKKELLLVKDTYKWANNFDINNITTEFREIMDAPTFVVGSGGSFSACHMFSLLQQFRGNFSKPVTPLELYHSRNAIRNSNVAFLSASGRNSDILFAFEQAIKYDPRNIWGLCMRENTKLGLLSANYSISNIIELNNPAGKDGFLATNSLVAYFIILARLFGLDVEIESLELLSTEEGDIVDFVEKLPENFTLTVLYAGWGQPVAIDIESKFTEAGLGNILLSDFRNFGHGRHHWFDKKRGHSAIIALVTPEESALANKTLDLLPAHIPKLVLSTRYELANATIDLLIKSFHVTVSVGSKVGIDPGRPGVPPYGSRLYNLRYLSLVGERKQDYKSINAILRKLSRKSINELSSDEVSYWSKRLKLFKERINNTQFGSVILDYDGTLCAQQERAGLPSLKIIEVLNNFAAKGFIVGIVTGRGKSVREALVKCINKEYLNKIIIGYYNGAVVAPLDEKTQPNINLEPKKSLQIIYDTLNKQSAFIIKPQISLRPLQLTIEFSQESDWNQIKSISLEHIYNLQLKDIQVLESDHSIDVIIKPDVSKTNIINYCINECNSLKISNNFLCIGDKGRFPGNDYELLKSPYSLSVDEVSSDPDTCWNLSSVGKRGVDSCLEYLTSATFKKTYFTLSI